MTDGLPTRKRVLAITRNLPPFVGGMERLLCNAVHELSTEFNVSVIGPAGCERALPETVSTKGVAPYPLWRFLLSCLLHGIRLGRRFPPHIVFAGSGLTAPIVLIVSRLTGAIAVAQLHGLDLVARHWIYRSLFVTTLRRLDAVIVNSRNTGELAVKERIAAERIHIVHPGIDLPEPHAAEVGADFLVPNDLTGKTILLSVGRLTARKGLSAFIRQCMPDIVRLHPNCVLLIVGAPPKDALKSDSSEIVKIERAVAETGLVDQVRLLGAVSDTDLEIYYRSTDIFVFPAVSVPGDVEGFGIVAIEAAARGVPTVAFAVGGIPDAVEDGASGFLVQPGCYTVFTQKISTLLDDPGTISRQDCIRHAHRFRIANFGQQLRHVFAKLAGS